MTEAGWTRDKEVEPAIDELKAQVQKIYNAGYQQGRVAGLAKAVEIIKANTDVKKAIEIIRLHSLAQQAQGEKGVMDGN